MQEILILNAVFHYNRWKYRSKFVEGDNVNRLHIVLERLDHLLHEIRADFIVLHGRPNLNLEDAVGDWLLLPFGLPAQAIQLDGDDLVCEGIQVSILTPWLDFPDDKGLGHRSGLLLFALGLLSLLLHSLCSGSISFRIFCKWIKLIFSRRSGGCLGSCLLLSRGWSGDASISFPGSPDRVGELSDDRVPGESGWVRFWSRWCILDLFISLSISGALFCSTKPLIGSKLHFDRVVAWVDYELRCRGNSDLGSLRWSSFGRCWLLSLLLLGCSSASLLGCSSSSTSLLLSTFGATFDTTLLELIILTLLLFCFCFPERSRCFLVVRDKVHAVHVGTKSLWNNNTLFGLIVLENATHCSRRCTHRAV